MSGVFEVLPAIDLMDGQAVQLVQGEAESAQRFGDPLEAAARWTDAGARWLHVVDLDAAFGRGDNAEVVAAIVAASPVQVQVSGGVRDDVSLDRTLATGCAWASIGTAAIERPKWCARVLAEHADRIAISIDVADGRLAGRGWTTRGPDALEAVARLAAQGCRRFVVTDIGSDGMLGGPNLELLHRVCERLRGSDGDASIAVIASGGVSALDDIVALRTLEPEGVAGAIIGTALYRGRIDLREALRVAQ